MSGVKELTVAIQTLATIAEGLTTSVDRLARIIENSQSSEGPIVPRNEYHHTFHDSTPLSALEGWNNLPAQVRNALVNNGLVTFGELKKRSKLDIKSLGKKGAEKFCDLLRANDVRIDYFVCLNMN